MADAGIGEAALIASIASTAMTAGSSIGKAEGTKAADDMQADKLKRAAEFGKLQAGLTDTTMREQLNTTLGNIDVIRAAARIDPTSPTTAAIREHETMISDRQRNAALLNIRSQTAEDEASAAYLRKAGDFALMQGYVSAGATVAGAIGKGLAGSVGGSSGGFYGGSPENNPLLRVRDYG